MIDKISIILLIVVIIWALMKQYIDENRCKDSKDAKDIEKSENKIDEFCSKHYKKIWILLAFIIFITVIYKFGKVPEYFGVDEVGMFYDAYCLSEYGTDRYMNSYPLYLINFGGGQSALNAYLVAICIKIFGSNIFAYRLPTLLVYFMSVIVSYLLISKAKNKKTALLFTFLIITCPWSIFNAREALDCNLYAGFFMLTLYLLDKAKKNYQYVIAGVSIGITLYTYCLSWISMPVFLLVWAIYMLYIKKVRIKQLILCAIPAFIFSMPLIYFLLVNYGIVNNTQIGIFTLPILTEFRSNQIGIQNIFITGLESIKTIFFAKNTIYLMYVPLFLIGYIIEWKNTIYELKNKKYGISSIMVIAFTTLFISLLTTRIPTANKANVLYIPLLYFVTIGILGICKNSRAILITIIIIITLLFGSYLYNYYNVVGVRKPDWYNDSGLMEITQAIEKDEKLKKKQKYVYAFTCGPDIYTIFELKLSPEEYMSEVVKKQYAETIVKTTKVRNYNYIYLDEEIKNIDLNSEDNIFIITNNYTEVINYLEENGYSSTDYKYYKILMKNH